jgi:hypothetical protein
MQFKIDRNFTLNSFEGSLISITRHISKNKSIRLGLSGFGEKYDTNDNQWFSQDSEMREHIDKCYTTHNIEIILNLNTYINPKSIMKFYYGLGPIFQYNRNKNNIYKDMFRETTSRQILLGHYADKNIEEIFGYGINFLWGVEWFPHDNFSLVAEYGANLTYSITNRKRRIKDYDDLEAFKISEEKIPKYSFYPSNVKFGISIYLNK